MRKLQVTLLLLITIIIISVTTYYEVFIRKGVEQREIEEYQSAQQDIFESLKNTKKIIVERPNKETKELEAEFIITDEYEINEVVSLCSQAQRGSRHEQRPPKIFKFYDEQDNLIVDYDFVYFMNFKGQEEFYDPIPSNIQIELYKKYYPENWKTED